MSGAPSGAPAVSGEARALYLSPTATARFANCPRSWWYHYRSGLRPKLRPATLVAGELLHAGFNAIVAAALLNRRVDAASAFRAAWREALQAGMVFSTTQTPASIEASACALLEQFPSAWRATGLMPLIDHDGAPVLEREYRTLLAPGIGLRARLDGLFVSIRDGSIAALDFKTQAAETDPLFVSQADQLTVQQIVVEANRAALGIECVDRVGFMVALRRAVPKSARGKGPVVLAPQLVPARTGAVITDYRQRILWMADDIARGRFPRNPRMSHNTPCVECDYRLHCAYGSSERLVRMTSPTP